MTKVILHKNIHLHADRDYHGFDDDYSGSVDFEVEERSLYAPYTEQVSIFDPASISFQLKPLQRIPTGVDPKIFRMKVFADPYHLHHRILYKATHTFLSHDAWSASLQQFMGIAIDAEQPFLKAKEMGIGHIRARLKILQDPDAFMYGARETIKCFLGSNF